MPRVQRTVLALHYVEDLPDDRIADLLDLSLESVRTNARRGLEALRTSTVM